MGGNWKRWKNLSALPNMWAKKRAGKILRKHKEEEFANEKRWSRLSLTQPNSIMHPCLYTCMSPLWVPSKQHCFCKGAVSAEIFRCSVTALSAGQDFNRNDVWQWRLMKNPHHFEGLWGISGPPNSSIKHLFRFSIAPPARDDEIINKQRFIIWAIHPS